jgi:RNA polymerase primary sigma factor
MVQTQDMPLIAFDQYRREVSWIPQLTDEEETRLLQSIERRKQECAQQCPGCNTCEAAQQAHTRLVEGYQHLVSRLAWRYASRNREVYLDLVQEGNLGLLRALEQYDSKVGVATFGTWVFAWVKGAMRRALSDEGVIRLPWRKVEAIRQLEQVRDELVCELGYEPTVEEIAQKMQITTREVCERLALCEQRRVMSLDVLVDENGEVTVGDMLEDTSFPVGGEVSLEDVLQHLTDQELAVILLRYGLGEHRVHTQREAARVLGMGLPKVQLLDQRARLRLRRVLEEQVS